MKPDKIYVSIVFLMILSTASWIISCTHNADITNLPEICFKRDVLPIYKNNCAKPGCHDGTGEAGTFNNYPDISQSVVAGNPNSSRSYQAIIATWGENKMPPDQPLSLENRTIIRLWIEQGAKETACPVVVMAPEESKPGIPAAVDNTSLTSN
jgi:hypothetical protein